VCNLSYPSCKQHELYYIVVCGVSGSAILFNVIKKKPPGTQEKVVERKIRVLIFQYELV
jgi:hypothetical protein